MSLHNEVLADLPAVIADEGRYLQILLNLVANALESTMSGQVKVTAEREDSVLRIRGFEVCQKLRKRFGRSELPILSITAKTQPRDVATGFEVGGNDYLGEPTSREELEVWIEAHLEVLGDHRHLENLVARRMAELKILR